MAAAARSPVVIDRAPLRAVFEAVRHFDEVRHVGAVLVASLLVTRGRQAAKGGAVVVAVAVENLVLLLAAVLLVRNLAHHLEGFLVGLGAGVGKEHPAHARHLLEQLCRQRVRGLAAQGLGEIAHLHQLIAYRIGDFLATVTHVHRPHAAGGGIQILFPVLVPDAHAQPAHDGHQILLVDLPVVRQVLPDCGGSNRLERGCGLGVGDGFHGRLPVAPQRLMR
jgi:hypothetical protein